MANEWIVEFTDEFELWWLELSELVQEKCAAVVDLLTREGPNLGFPYSSSIRGSVHALRELRIQCGGHPYRILYAFDPQRNALLILDGDKPRYRLRVIGEPDLLHYNELQIALDAQTRYQRLGKFAILTQYNPETNDYDIGL
jgi:hypothetical protein